MAYLLAKTLNEEIFLAPSTYFTPWIKLFLTMFIMLHYDLAMLKNPEVLPALRWILSLRCEPSYWNIWNYVLQIHGLVRDLCNKGCKTITCLKLSLLGVLLFGDTCVYFPKGVNLFHIFLNKSSCSANVFIEMF